MIPSFVNDTFIQSYGAECMCFNSEVKFYAHLRPVSLQSAARPGRYLKILLNICFAFFFVK